MIRDITIRPILNGFIVTVGCQALAFTSVDELTIKLAGYLRDPEKAEKEFLKEAINRRHTLGSEVHVPPQTAEPMGAGGAAVTAQQVVNAANDGTLRAPDHHPASPAPDVGGSMH